MSSIPTILGLPLAPVFLAYAGLIAALISAVLLRYLPLKRALIGIGVIAIWLTYAGAMGESGIIADPSRMPPGVFLMLTPIIAFIAIVLGRSPAGHTLATSIPLTLLFALQSFRVGVELTLSSLHHAGLTPRLLTLPGGNVEILIGLSAPLIAFAVTRGSIGRRIALVWNIAGLLSLLNVAARAVLTAPGPLNLIHAELPNVALGLFPFTFIPGFMAPLAMMLHVLAFRALRATKPAKTASLPESRFAF
jgi:hypothetical protein